MADINLTLTFILENEDAGLTGTVTSGPGWVCRWGIDSRGNPGIDIPNLSLVDARGIYAAKYVTPVSAIRDQDVQDRVADCLVNPGTVTGAKLVQQAINLLLHPDAVKEDGVIGPETISRLNGFAIDDIVPMLRSVRDVHYWENDQGPNLTGLRKRACR